jgi:2-oxoisovalerate dehydrogenase E1 component
LVLSNEKDEAIRQELKQEMDEHIRLVFEEPDLASRFKKKN